MTSSRTILSLLLAALVLSLLIGCGTKVEKPVQSSTIPDAPEVPKNLQTTIGDSQILLSWSVSDMSKVSQFLIYRGDTTRAESVLLDSTTETTYTDNNLRNSLRYVYQVTTLGKNGLESKKSAIAAATPNLFSVSILDGAKYSNNSNVTVNLAGPIGTRFVLLSNDSFFVDADWSAFAGTKSWKLASGDGQRFVYAKFRDGDGSETARFTSDDITVDTKASITSVTENSAGATLTAGSVIHFSLNAGETDGAASVDVTGLGTIILFDSNPGSADGIYETDYVIPGGVDVINGTVTGNFTDAAGNKALARAATTVINIANPPAPTTVSTFVVSESEIEIDWVRSTASDFANYLLFRSETNDVTTSSTLLQSQPVVGTTTFRDTDRQPSHDYYYAVFTVDKSGLTSKSNIAKATTFANTLPKAVTLFVSHSDSTSVTLGWTPNDDKDFQSYRIYRSASTPVAVTNANLRGTITAQGTTTLSDTGLPKGDKFYYVVVVYDKYGAASPVSNEVQGPNP